VGKYEVGTLDDKLEASCIRFVVQRPYFIVPPPPSLTVGLQPGPIYFKVSQLPSARSFS
jgi:hypothetical protein